MAGRSVSVASGVALRATRRLIKSPLGVVSQMAVPLFFFIAFTGALSAVGSTRGFGYYDFTAFEFVFVLYQGAMFAGSFTAIEVAIDYASGIGDRLMLSAPRRTAIIAGYLLVALGRAALAIALVWALAAALHMPVRGSALEITALIALALLLSLAAALYGIGIALRFRSAASSALIMIPTFMIMFLAPVFSPRDKLSGWLKTAAGVNPLTYALEAGRGLLADDPVHVLLAFGAVSGLVIAFAVWALRGMRAAERGRSAAPKRRPARGSRARRAGARARA
jgi:ABC-2 type transport system permease protein